MKNKFMIVGSGSSIDIEFADTFEKAVDIKKNLLERYKACSFKILPFSKLLLEHYLNVGHDVGESIIDMGEIK